ncbi:hypothetical protein ES332_D08G129700v1 [Gossypium tomentosum]|uniref:Uncharacterized protein n=1 Tax=Gossypium tomentosum TaxID=34277 RepID=A0A5D2JUF4_GOSTO|nr:hypothetical protein ES332_D08G129700v1 [Gossypium tomentosum]
MASCDGIRFCDGPVPVSVKITIGSWSLELLACWLLYNFYHNAIFVLMLFWSIRPFALYIDYFQIFGLLEGKYEVWQRKLHPDLVFKIHQVQNPST